MLVVFLSAAVALVVTCFTVWLTSPWLRPELRKVLVELDECKRDRVALRLRQKVLEEALLLVLPVGSRGALSLALAEYA